MIAALGMRYGTRRGDRTSPSRCRKRWPWQPTAPRSRWPRNAAPSRCTMPRTREVDNPMIARIREADPALYEEMVRVRPPQHRHADDRPHGYDDRSCRRRRRASNRCSVPSTSAAARSTRSDHEREDRLRGRSGRLVRRSTTSSTTSSSNGSQRQRLRYLTKLATHLRRRAGEARRRCRPTTRRRPTTSTGWPRSRCRARSRNGSTTRSR